MSLFRSALLLSLVGLSLASWRHEPRHSFESSTVHELVQTKIALRNAQAQLYQQEELIGLLRLKANAPPAPPHKQPPVPQQPAQPAQPQQRHCAGCGVLSALMLLGLASGVGCVTGHSCARACGGLLWTIGSIFAGFHLISFLLPLLGTLLPLGFLLGPALLLPLAFKRCCGRTTSVPRGAVLPATPLARGSQGPGVVQLQQTLISLKHMDPSAIKYAAGLFGPFTSRAVAEVQLRMDVQPTGVYDQAVKKQLENELRKASSTTDKPAKVPVEPATKTEQPGTLHEEATKGAVDVEPTTPVTTEPAEPAVEFPGEWRSSVADLVEMGFPVPAAQAALLSTAGEMNAAVKQLVSLERSGI